MFCYDFAMLLLCFAMLLILLCYAFVFLVITRYHVSFERCHLVGILPTDLRELSKPKFERAKRGKTQILGGKDLKSENCYLNLLKLFLVMFCNVFAMFCYVSVNPFFSE